MTTAHPARLLLLILLSAGMVLNGQWAGGSCPKRSARSCGLEAASPCRTAAAASCCRAIVRAVEASSCCMSRSACSPEPSSPTPCEDAPCPDEGDCKDRALGTCPLGRWVGIVSEDASSQCWALMLARVDMDVLRPVPLVSRDLPPPQPVASATRRALQSVWLT